MYQQRFGLSTDQQRPKDTDWTGAEIRSCCRLAALLDVPLIEAAANVVPVAITAGESVERVAELGGWSVSVGRSAGRLLPWGGRDAKTWPASKPWRSVQ